MGAEAIANLIDRIDFDAEEIKLRETIDAAGTAGAACRPSAGRRPSSA